MTQQPTTDFFAALAALGWHCVYLQQIHNSAWEAKYYLPFENLYAFASSNEPKATIEAVYNKIMAGDTYLPPPAILEPRPDLSAIFTKLTQPTETIKRRSF